MCGPMFIQTEKTPNPNVLKFLPGRIVLEGVGREFRQGEDCAASHLAHNLLIIEGVASVYFGHDFLTVKRDPDLTIVWDQMKAPILSAIMDHYLSGNELITHEDKGPDLIYMGETAQIVAEIKALLEERVRPAVAQDGGDIVFEHFDDKDGTLYLRMKGACSGCPSSTATLRSGVESLMKHYVPEVRFIEAVPD